MLYLYDHITEEAFTDNSEKATQHVRSPTGRALILTNRRLTMPKPAKVIPDDLFGIVKKDWLTRTTLDDYHDSFLLNEHKIKDSDRKRSMKAWGAAMRRRELAESEIDVLKNKLKLAVEATDKADGGVKKAAKRVLELHGRQEPIEHENAFYDVSFSRQTGTIFLVKRAAKDLKRWSKKAKKDRAATDQGAKG